MAKPQRVVQVVCGISIVAVLMMVGALVAVRAFDVDFWPLDEVLVHARIAPVLLALSLLLLLSIYGLVRLRQKQWFQFEQLLVLALGLMITLGASWVAHTDEARRHYEIFSHLAHAQSARVADFFDKLSAIELEGLAHFVESTHDITPAGFREYAEYLTHNPAVQAWEWIPAVPERDRRSFEQEVRQRTATEFEIWEHQGEDQRSPASNRNVYYPVLYIAPLIGNERALGYDLGSEPVRRVAIEEAQRLGVSIGTDPVTLVQETGTQKGILVVRPVFEKGDSKLLRGVVLAVFRFGVMLENATTNESGLGKQYVSIALSQRRENKPDELLATTSATISDQTRPAYFSMEVPISACGKAFSLRMSPTSAFHRLYPTRAGWLTALVGLMLTAMLYFWARMVFSRREELGRIVAERTSLLQRSEEQVRLLLNSTAEAIYGIDLQGNCTFANPSCLTQLGCADVAQLLGKNMHQLIHHSYADHRPMNVDCCRIYKAFQGGDGVHVDDEVLWRVDGTCFPAEYWSYPQIVGGRTAGAVVTFHDISERKHTEESLQHQFRLQQLLMDISSRYINLPLDLVEHAIYVSLGNLARFVGADRAYIFDYDFKKQICKNTHEWCEEGVQAQIDQLQAVPLDALPDWVDTHRRGDVVFIADVLALPAGNLRSILEPQGIKSLLTVPMMGNGESLGFVGFDSVKKHHNYSGNEQHLLGVFAQMLVNVRLRKGVEEEIKRQAALITSLLDSIPDIIFFKDLNGVYLGCNPHFVEFVGRPKEEIVGKTDYDLFDKNVADQFRDFDKSMLQSRTARHNEEVITYPDGRTMLIDTLKSPYRGPNNVLLGILGISRDITERRKAEAIIQRESSDLRILLNNFPFLVWLKDGSGRFTAVNEPFALACGFSTPEELLGKTDMDIWPKHLAEAYRADDAEVMASGKRKSVEEVVRDKGVDKWYETYKAPLFDNGCKVIGTTGFSRDITDRKHFESALQESRNFLDRIINSVGDPIFVKDTQHNWVLLNDAFCQLMGCSREALLGKNDFDCFKKEEAEISWAKDEDVFRTGHENISEERVKDAQGVTHTVLTRKVIYVDESKQSFLVGVIVDITQLKNIQDELARSNKELEQFAYVASHDLQEPLRKITLFSQLLQEKQITGWDSEAKDYLVRMCSAATRMSNLISDLLDYSRVATREQMRVKVDLNKIISDVIGDLEVQIRESQAQIEVGELSKVTFDVMYAQQLFQNLIGNALKFAKKDVPPVIKIVSRETEREYMISVEDNGIGFEMKYSERIFGAFQRLHTRDEYRGSGIGLAICKRIVQQVGGQIDVQSRPGEGSTFTVRLLK